MRDNNTITAFHIKIVNDQMKVRPKKYNWHIPKRMRYENIEQGDIVLVRADSSYAPVLVIDAFREDIEDTGRAYKSVKKVLERAPISKENR